MRVACQVVGRIFLDFIFITYHLTSITMHYEELQTIWNAIFRKLGYHETKPGNWTLDMEELVVALHFWVDEGRKEFGVEIGLILKKWVPKRILRKSLLEDSTIGEDLHNILMVMGELEYYLNNLSSYDTNVNSPEEIENNCEELAQLYINKVVPHIEELNDCARTVKSFNRLGYWKPFLRYFQPSPTSDEIYKGMLSKYYGPLSLYRLSGYKRL